MIGEFLESLGTRLAERWAAVTAPALLFWALAALTYANAHGGSSAWHDARDWFAQQDGAVQVVVIGGALAGVMLSATLVQWMTVPAIRALEGYWPFLAPLQRVINTRRRRRIENDEKRWQQLMSDVHDGNPSPEARRELMNVEARLSRVPPDPRERMPTRLGDVLRAGETWPRAKYGLDAAVCLPRIWLLLPETTRSELGMARARLDAAVAVWSWALLSLALTIWAWWRPDRDRGAHRRLRQLDPASRASLRRPARGHVRRPPRAALRGCSVAAAGIARRGTGKR